MSRFTVGAILEKESVLNTVAALITVQYAVFIGSPLKRHGDLELVERTGYTTAI